MTSEPSNGSLRCCTLLDRLFPSPCRRRSWCRSSSEWSQPSPHQARSPSGGLAMQTDAISSRGPLRLRNHLHLLPVIGKLLPAVQADDVGCLNWGALGGNRCRSLSRDGKRAVLVRTPEH